MHLSNRLVAWVCLTSIALGTSASATVISGSSSAYGVFVNVTGPLNVSVPTVAPVSGTAPPVYNNTNNVASLSVPTILSTGIIDTSAASDVDGLLGARQATATAETNNLSVGINILLTPVIALTASEVTSTATVTGDPLAGVGGTTIVGGSLQIDSLAPIPIPLNPAPNTILVNNLLGITVTLNEQVFSGSLGLTVNAIHIQFVNALALGLNGDIIVSQAQAALTSDGVIPEPSTALLVGAGLVGLGVHRRRR
jgi:hypothetical protein